ncbi:MAG: hypothetical protein ACLTLQ_21370 [[Clostridium] scindens]
MDKMKRASVHQTARCVFAVAITVSEGASRLPYRYRGGGDNVWWICFGISGYGIAADCIIYHSDACWKICWKRDIPFIAGIDHLPGRDMWMFKFSRRGSSGHSSAAMINARYERSFNALRYMSQLFV